MYTERQIEEKAHSYVYENATVANSREYIENIKSYIAGWKANPNKWTDEDMKEAFQYALGAEWDSKHGYYTSTFEEWLEWYKEEGKDATRKEETGTDNISE